MYDIVELLVKAVDEKASDIFITSGIPPVFKISGELVKCGEDVLNPESAESLIRVLFKNDSLYKDFLENGEKDFSFSLTRKGRFRVNAYMQRGSIAAAIRVLSFGMPDPEKLGIPQEVLDLHKENKGLILITGPAGCGKTTTLTSIVDIMNTNKSCHIITLEDPIEYLHSHKKSIVDQREIGTDSKSFAAALRAALRQAPDVILVGEMRDTETISIALTAAETGHLVLSSLHTIGAAKTIDRIIDVFPPNQQQQVRVQLSSVLHAIVSQQLLPSLDGSMVPVFEIMQANNAIKNMIRESKTPQIDAVINSGRESGMISMDYSISELYNKGIISYDDAFAYCSNKELMLKYIARGHNNQTLK